MNRRTGEPENEIIELSFAGSPVRRFPGYTFRLSLVLRSVAADPVVELGLVRNPSPLLHAILALVLLLTATVLAIYKPFGMTPYGARQQMRVRPGAPGLVSAPVQAIAAGTPRRWEYLL